MTDWLLVGQKTMVRGAEGALGFHRTSKMVFLDVGFHLSLLAHKEYLRVEDETTRMSYEKAG